MTAGDSNPGDPPLISFNNVSKDFTRANGRLVPALRDISFGILPNEIVAIVGPSGTGKSTLLRLAAGLLAPSTGCVSLAGQPVTGPQPGIGLMFQNAVLLPWRDVVGNVMLPAQVLRLDRATALRRARDLLRRIGLGEQERHYPYELSGGMQQRVAICRALSTHPRILLLDEPFAALDPLTREELCLDLLRIAAAEDKTVLLVTHNVEEAVFMSDRVVVISSHPGRMVGIVNILLERPRELCVVAQRRFFDYVREIRVRIGRA